MCPPTLTRRPGLLPSLPREGGLGCGMAIKAPHSAFMAENAFVTDRTEHPASCGALQRNGRSAVPRGPILPVRPAC
jgi:hypothetical protein